MYASMTYVRKKDIARASGKKRQEIRNKVRMCVYFPEAVHDGSEYEAVQTMALYRHHEVHYDSRAN